MVTMSFQEHGNQSHIRLFKKEFQNKYSRSFSKKDEIILSQKKKSNFAI